MGHSTVLLAALSLACAGCTRAADRPAAGRASAQEAPVAQFRLALGDQASYQVHTKITRADSQGEREEESTRTLTVTAVSVDKASYWTVARYWAANEPAPEAVAAEPKARLEFDGLNLDEEMKGGSDARPLRSSRLPAPPRRDLELGDEFEQARGPSWETGLHGSLTVRSRVTAREKVGDRQCLLIETTAADPLPCELEPAGMYEGGPPPKPSLLEFGERCWVAEDNGWVAKLEQKSVVQTDHQGAVSTTSSESTSLLTSVARLTGAELDREFDQIARLRSIDRHRRGAMAEYNTVEDADTGLAKLAAFRADHPDSRYARLIPAWEQGFAQQREQGLRLQTGPYHAVREIGQPGPPFSGPGPEGRALGSAQLRGRPAVLIFLNLTECWAKRQGESAPDMEALWRKWKPHGVQFVGICLHGGPRADFSAQHGITFPLIDTGLSDMHQAYRMYGFIGTAVLDPEGVIRYYRWDFYPKELDGFLVHLTR